MPVYFLSNELKFPPVDEAEDDGLLAVGGDLSPQRLLKAYSLGIFPWYEKDPVLWFYTKPRFVLFPEKAHISRSLQKIIKKKLFEIRIDTAFEKVIKGCAKRKNTWINKDMKAAYIKLHELGYAHSFEAWQNDKLAGGLYGISLGKIFFAESMYYDIPNASKAALCGLIDFALKANFDLIDCQVYTENLKRFGAENISENRFNEILKKAQKQPAIIGSWTH